MNRFYSYTLALISACALTVTPCIAQQSDNGFTSFMSKVGSVFSSVTEKGSSLVQSARQSYPDLLTSEKVAEIESTLLQGDNETTKTLYKKILEALNKPTNESVADFIAWFDDWKDSATVTKFKTFLAKTPDATEYESKAEQGNLKAQAVVLWINRCKGEYAAAAEWEAKINGSTLTATELKENYSEDLKQVKKDAKRLSMPVFWNLVQGEMEYRGIGASQDLAGAISSYRKAALVGCDPAIYQMVRDIYASQGLAKATQKIEAMLWLKKLAYAGEAPAANLALGIMYMNGNGVTRDHETAVYYLEKAAAVLPGKPALRSSICTGERVAGYISTENGKFIDVMLIQNDEDLEVFRQTYGLSDHEIRTIY